MYERTDQLLKEKFKEYLLPSIMTSMAVSMATVVDSMIVGNLLGDTALAAIGLSTPVIFVINVIYMLFGFGGLTCASVAIGRREREKANKLFTFTILGGISVMFLMVIIVLVLMEPITTMLAVGDTVTAGLTADYLRPMVFAGPALMFASGMAMFVRADGNPKTSATIVMISNVVNLVLDYLLIRFLHTGIMGAGLSTTLGYVAGAFIIIPYLKSDNRSFRFVKITKEDLRTFVELLSTGVPKALIQFSVLLRSCILNGLIMSGFGAIGMTVMTVCTNIYTIANIFISGTSDALLPIIGTLYGEKDYFGIKKVLKRGFRVLILASVVLLIFFVWQPRLVAMMFGLTSEEVLNTFVPALRMYVLYLPFVSVSMLMQNFYTTTGRKTLASVGALLDGFVFVCSFAFVLSSISPNLIWLCYPCSGIMTLLTLFLMGLSISKKENVEKILLLKEEKEEGICWNLTIKATVEDAAGLSSRVIEFCKEQGVEIKLANRVGILLEEMAVNIVRLAHNKKTIGEIDIFIRVTKEELLLRFRDNGIAFNPLVYKKEEEVITDGIELMKRLATTIDYTRQLGFNTTIMTIQR